MELEISQASQLDQNGELGSWHPAMRPDSHVPTHDYKQPAKTSSMNPSMSEAKALDLQSSEGPLPDLRSTVPQHEAPFSLTESGPEEARLRDTPHEPVNGEDAVPSNHLVKPEDEIPSREAVILGSQSPDSKQLIGSAIENEFTIHSQGVLGNGSTGLSFPRREDEVDGDQKPAILPHPVFHDQERIEDLDTARALEQPRSMFENFGTIDRTNSFPEVPSIRHTELQPPQSLAHSQAQDIMEEDEALGSEPLVSDNPEDFDPFPSTADGDESGFFISAGRLHPDVAQSPADEEARFEEGLPLMSLESNGNRLMDDLGGFYHNLAGSPRQPGNSTGGHREEYEIASPDESFFRPQPLDRKSTTQVLNSLHHIPRGDSCEETGRDSLLDALPNGDEATALRSLTTPEPAGGGSKDTIESNPDISFRREEKEDDLAAMWKAALGDDELLDESEPFVDPAAFFDDDGEGFLEEINDVPIDQLQSKQMPSENMQGFDTLNSSGTIPQHQYVPTTYNQSSVTPTSPYLPGMGPAQQLPQPTFGMSHSVSAPAGLPNPTHQQSSFADAPSSARPRMPQSTQSFADKSKGGYTSPYDLPMDVMRPPKKRNYTQQIQAGPNAQITANNMAPPRSTSMYTKKSPSVGAPPPLPSVVGAIPTPPVATIHPPTLKSKSSFFEELPSVKPRPSSGTARAAPVPPKIPFQPMLQHEPRRPDPARSSSSSSGISQAYQLLPPEPMSLYPNVSSQEPVTRAVPALKSRYSPAPSSREAVPPPRNRYASSPFNGPHPQPAQVLPFQPRTSSPLATQSTPATQITSVQALPPQASTFENPAHPGFQHESVAQDLRQSPQYNRPSPPSTNSRYTPSSSSPPSSSNSLPPQDPNRLPHTSLSNNYPQETAQSISDDPNFGPPRRSQTQSPSAMRSRPELPPTSKAPYQRPASVNQNSYASSAQVHQVVPHIEHQRRNPVSSTLGYITPSDGRENDHLERWKGCPIFTFGFGGTVVSSFPKQIPRYAVGQSIPMIKCSPGEVNVRNKKAFVLEENIANFPGPLRSKSKKKEVLDWLQKRIIELENTHLPIIEPTTLPDPHKRHEEKIILWKVTHSLVEHDGAIEGNPTAENAVRTILSPELAAGDEAKLPLYHSSAPPVGISRSGGSISVAERPDSEALEGLRKILLHGEREKAVWHAVDRKLWGHAMLLASTLDKGIWKQVLQEFNSQEVKAFGHNTEPLATLYQVFAGNWEESVDQLVPPSARAGLQMVSKVSTAGPTKNALEGLDRWRETLTLILSNRTMDDGNALLALGRLLAGYGRTEAAHVCYIFAKTPGLFGGPDDPQVSVALLGADHVQQPYDYSRDFDSILLTEVYDFARTVLAPSPIVTVSPHLQSYKLYHALTLAEYGYRSEAQNYCDTITSALKSTTKLSPYYHNLLFGALDDLIQRLRQAPKDGSTSMIAGLSMDKVSGSVWSRLNQFIAGDESDAESTASGNMNDPAAGPFARVAGDSPNISRPPSSNDLYGSYPPMGGIPPPTPVTAASNSRYAPAGQYTPRTSLEQPARPSQEFQRTAQSEVLRPPFTQQRNTLSRSRSTSTRSLQDQQQHDLHKPPSQPSAQTTSTESYLPTLPPQPTNLPAAPPYDPPSSLYQQKTYQPSPHIESQTSYEPYRPTYEPVANNSYKPWNADENPPEISNHPQQSKYEPPSSYGYEPPSYDPETQDGSDSPKQMSPKKKSFMYGDEDDDDFAAKAAAVLREQKAQKDREADEAFKKAAEADGRFS